MRIVIHHSRRQFGILMGTTLLAATSVGRATAHNGPHTVNVSIKAFKFDPADLTVRVGDTVEWTNQDIAPHTATAKVGDWDTGRLARGDSGSVTFETPGEYDYVCAFHPRMAGRIVVSAQP
jgi:plastocyanin